jgi:hypothetical protein
MAIFDIKTFLKVNGSGKGAITSLGTAFGMPSCMLNLTNDLMRLIPSPLLESMSDSASDGRDKADEVTKEIVRKLFLDTGIIEFDTEDGTFKFVSDSSRQGLDKNETGLLGKAGAFLNTLNKAAAFGSRLYNNYEAGKAQINGIIDCFGRYSDILKYTGGAASEQRDQLLPAESEDLFNQEYGLAQRRLAGIKDFLSLCDNFIDRANGILKDRALDPSLEPSFDPNWKSLLSSTGFEVTDPNKPKDDPEVIRLVFGPPKSVKGQFLLSVDGIYYDSQTSGIVNVLSTINKRSQGIDPSERWKFEYDPNLGGKGVAISNSDIIRYSNTLFDKTLIDDSPYLREYYDADHFLKVLNGQKDKRILDLSGHVESLIEGDAPQSVILNTKQSLLSEIALFTDKVNRRKKQIELAIKLPSIYGGGNIFSPGKIPINDFSYLQSINFSVDLLKQKELVLRNDEVSGVVLPLKPTFVTTPSRDTEINYDHLLVANVGKGGIIYGGGVSSTSSIVLPITDTIVTDGLIAVYNFLEGDTVVPSSTKFTLANCNSLDTYNNAKLCGTQPSSMFPFGLGIAYLDGITRRERANPTIPNELGNFVVLPDTKEFNDLTYSQQGWSFDAWVHMPELNDAMNGFSDSTASALYRVILGCENVGKKATARAQTNILRMTSDFGDGVVRGMLMGFTRDRRLTKTLDPHNDTELNYPTSSLAFFIAPTQSYDASSAGFISKPISDAYNCNTDPGWYSMVIPTSSVVNGSKFGYMCREFMHLVVTFDYLQNTLNVFLDGKLHTASAITSVFGTPYGFPINVPSFRLANSFEYTPTNVNPAADPMVINGPKLNQYFTPWVLGGGYTDGNVSGNFMGGTYGGLQSGLKGFVGSVKFYNKPLTGSEVYSNYKNQADFFKNIQVPYNCWDEIMSYP